MNPFLRYLADKKTVRTDRQTDRHTPMTTRPCGLRRAGKKNSAVITVLRYCAGPQEISCRKTAKSLNEHVTACEHVDER